MRIRIEISDNTRWPPTAFSDISLVWETTKYYYQAVQKIQIDHIGEEESIIVSQLEAAANEMQLGLRSCA